MLIKGETGTRTRPKFFTTKATEEQPCSSVHPWDISTMLKSSEEKLQRAASDCKEIAGEHEDSLRADMQTSRDSNKFLKGVTEYVITATSTVAGHSGL